MTNGLNSQTALERLRVSLCSLDASGPAGFEGLVQVLFERLLGRTIYLMNSGTQNGGDTYTGSYPDKLSIIWEDKRYRQNTSLPVDELTAKLDQASRNFPEMDIWVLLKSVQRGEGLVFSSWIGLNQNCESIDLLPCVLNIRMY